MGQFPRALNGNAALSPPRQDFYAVLSWSHAIRSTVGWLPNRPWVCVGSTKPSIRCPSFPPSRRQKLPKRCSPGQTWCRFPLFVSRLNLLGFTGDGQARHVPPSLRCGRSSGWDKRGLAQKNVSPSKLANQKTECQATARNVYPGFPVLGGHRPALVTTGLAPQSPLRPQASAGSFGQKRELIFQPDTNASLPSGVSQKGPFPWSTSYSRTLRRALWLSFSASQLTSKGTRKASKLLRAKQPDEGFHHVVHLLGS